MNCRTARNTMTYRGIASLSRPVREHLEQCRACTRFAERLETAEQVLAQRASEVTPTPGFERRIRDRLAAEDVSPIGWAALRLLPASLLLVLILLALLWFQGGTSTTGPAQLADAEYGTEDVLTWVLAEETTP